MLPTWQKITLPSILLLTSLCFAFDDTAQYTDFLIESKSLPIDKKLDANRTYLEEYPNSSYKNDIAHNIEALEKLALQKTKKENIKSVDTELFFKAQALSKTLSLTDKVSLWQQFIEENPHSIYLKDATYNLKKLTARKQATQEQIQAKAPNNQAAAVAKRLNYKDPKKATNLATTAGLLIPGMGHWYTKDYVPAGIFTALRIAGIGLFAKGYQDRSRSTQVTGVLVGLFSYIADIADAPFSVQRYNSKLDETNSAFLPIKRSSHNFMLSFRF